MKKIKNLTPHKVTIYDDENNIIDSFESEGVARSAGRTTEDFLLTSTPVRNETGQMIGCKALAVVK